MSAIDAKITQFKNKMASCQTMTDLLVAMSSWQSFCNNNSLTEDQKSIVDQVYLDAEQRLISKVKTSLW